MALSGTFIVKVRAGSVCVALQRVVSEAAHTLREFPLGGHEVTVRSDGLSG